MDWSDIALRRRLGLADGNSADALAQVILLDITKLVLPILYPLDDMAHLRQ
jgi:hypothetical protein